VASCKRRYVDFIIMKIDIFLYSKFTEANYLIERKLRFLSFLMQNVRELWFILYIVSRS
jgi:hypothetical protein